MFQVTISCDKICLRVNHNKKPLETFYTRIYKVLQHPPKHFHIKMNKNMYNKVAVGRLKPYVEKISK